jgi:hypothetical protein
MTVQLAMSVHVCMHVANIAHVMSQPELHVTSHVAPAPVQVVMHPPPEQSMLQTAPVALQSVTQLPPEHDTSHVAPVAHVVWQSPLPQSTIVQCDPVSQVV